MDKVLIGAPIVDTQTGRVTPEWAKWFDQINGSADIQTTVREVVTNVITGSGSAPSAVGWAALNKSGSNLADLEQRPFSALTGNLAWSQLPSGSGVWDANVRFTGTVTFDQAVVSTSIVPSTTTADVSLGTPSQKFAAVYAAEVGSQTLVADANVASAGGNFIVSNGGTFLARGIGPSDISIVTKHGGLAVNDVIYLKSFDRVEWMRVIAGPVGVAPGPYGYTVTRNLNGGSLFEWREGDAVFNTGATGDGFVDIYAKTGLLAGTGPTIVGNVRTGSAYSSIATRWALGNLKGLYGYATDTYGVALGDSATAWIAIDPANGIRMLHGSTVIMQIDAAGNAFFTGTVTAAGFAEIDLSNVTTADVVNKTGWAYPSTLNINGGAIQAATVTGTTIAAGTITAGNIAAGSITADRLNVTTLSAITANLGTVTAGSITGTTISGNTITGGTISGTTISGSVVSAGGGDVVLDSTGLSLTSGTGNSNRVKWTDGCYIQGSGNVVLSGPNGVTLLRGSSTLLFDGDLTTAGGSRNLGSASVQWHDIFLDGTLYMSVWAGGGVRPLYVDNVGFVRP